MTDRTEAETIAALATKAAGEVSVQTIVDPETHAQLTYLLTPRDMNAACVQKELDARLEAPRRRTGLINVASIDSFLAAVNRHKSESTVIYADDGASPKLTAVINDHRPGFEGLPGHRDHRVVYAPTLSDQWKSWLESDGKPLSMAEFAEHLEDNALDLVDPGAAIPASTQRVLEALNVKAAAPSVIRGLARGLTIHESSKVTEVRNLQSGECQVVFESEHRDEAGKPLSVPGAFLVAIPIYEGGPVFCFVARLRYRKAGAGIVWSYSLAQTDAAKREIMGEMVAQIRKETGCLALDGQP